MAREHVGWRGDEIGAAALPGGARVERDSREMAAMVLRALVAMARVSKRQQAELGVALRRAGLELDIFHQQEALRHLCDTAAIEDVIMLSDGAILLSVTAAGMARALGAADRPFRAL